MLENRLDKAMIKYNEAMSIKKTYELIVKRLKDERVGYDNQLAAIEQSLKGKEHDFEELLLLSHDANHAKELAEADLRKFELQIDQKRRNRQKEITEQREMIEQKQEKMPTEKLRAMNDTQSKLGSSQNMDVEPRAGLGLFGSLNQVKSAHKPKADHPHEATSEIDALQGFEEEMRRVREATGVTDVNEIIQKFSTQQDTHKNLVDLKKTNEFKL
jgi:hypothetical protein